MARPTKYNLEMAENFCLEIIDGKSIREICKDENYPSMTTIFNWLNKNKGFLEQYEKAKHIQADIMAEDMLSIAYNKDGEVQRDRLRIDARKWIASKLKPKKYGTGSQIDIQKDGTDITTIYLRTDFGEPVDFEGLDDDEVLAIARETNKRAVFNYNNKKN